MIRALLLITCFSCGILAEDPIVELSDGKIQGLVAQTLRTNLTFYAFMGIPFAAPPVGELRFQPPQPVERWEGIKVTKSNEHNICYQITSKLSGRQKEDCLILNVYTPVKPGHKADLPVLVSIYGGSFTHGFASFGYFGPQFLLEQRVIVVTFNYRVGPLGFLSTGDSVIPGNMGLKDQQFALKWVQKNIHLFGGNPKKVTIQGQSAGAASVTFHLLSPSSAGLFRAAIASSSSALCSWAHQSNAVETAYGIAAEIDPTFSRNRSSQELRDFLVSVDADKIRDSGAKYYVFGAVIEEKHKGALITESMYEALKHGRINKYPLFIGINSEEEIMKAGDLVSFKSRAIGYDRYLEKLMDADMNIADTFDKKAIGEEVRKIYTDGLFQNNLDKAIQFMSDGMFTKGTIRFGEMHANYTDVYFYQFSYHGVMGNNNNYMEGIGRVEHGEDGRYFWGGNVSLDTFPTSDVTTLDRYVQLQANFVKHLNPTPKETKLFQHLKWPKVTSEIYSYLDIDTDLTVKQNPREFSYRKWVQLYDKYGSEPFITY